MSKYQALDEAIIAGIAAERARLQGVLKPQTPYSPIWDDAIRTLARLANPQRRDVCRVIDSRLQALRKAGRIAYLSKAQSSTNHAGWVVMPTPRAAP